MIQLKMTQFLFLKMKNKIVILLSCFIMFFTPSMSQSLPEKELEEAVKHAIELGNQKKYFDGIEAFSNIVERIKQPKTETERVAYVMSQTFICLYCELSGRYEEGYNLAKRMLEENLTEQEREHLTTQYVLNGYLWGCSFIHKNSANFSKGRELLNEVLPYATDENGVRNRILSKFPMSWFFEAASYRLEQKYEQALPCYYESINGYHAIEDYKNELSCWLEYAGCMENLNDLKGAEDAYYKAAELSKQTSDVVTHMQVLRRLCELNSNIGNLYDKVIIEAKMDSIVNDNCPADVAYEYYKYRGNEARSLGLLDMAEQWYLKIEALLPSLEKPVAPRYICHTSLRDLYIEKNDYDLALDYANICLKEFQETNIGEESKDFLSYHSFIEIYKAKGDSAMAKKYVDSLMIAEKYITEPRELSMIYSIRGRFYSRFDDFKRASEDFLKADQILSTKYDEMEADRILLLPYLGGSQWKLNNNKECERYYKEYEKRVKALYGEESIEYLKAVNYLANAEATAGHFEEGCRDYERSVALLKRMTKEKLPYLNTEERETFWAPFSSLLTDMTPFAIESKLFQNDFTRSCYDALVLSKAFLLESERSLYDILKNNGTTEDLNNLMAIAAIQSQMRDLEKDYFHNGEEIMQLNQRKSTMERSLLAKCQKNGNLTSFMEVDYLAVKNCLTEGDVLIDFTDYVSRSQRRKYAAYIVERSQTNPMLIPLFSESQIDSLQIPRPDMYYEEPYSQEILNILWKPFEEHIKEGSTIYYVPSHILFQIALESLPMADGSLLGDHYNFVRLSSAREVGNIHNTLQFSQKGKSAVLYGGLKYDLSSEEMQSVAEQYDVSPLLAMRGDIARGDSIYRELKETKKEIEKIESYLTKSKINVTPYSGIQGTEESFLNMNDNSPCILHIATHGFYYTPEQADAVDYLRGYKDAMSLSGLVLSGGNAAWRGKELPAGVLGGILTARNIARMDMSGTELVVLSACQTGQGKATSEGLYGLQRAFKKAGVQCMVMTLWNVSDVASREFMEEFYKNLADKNNGWNKRKSFDEARKYIRKKYNEAYYWAAFVMLD